MPVWLQFYVEIMFLLLTFQGVIVLMFFLFHLRLVCLDMTTIEYMKVSNSGTENQ